MTRYIIIGTEKTILQAALWALKISSGQQKMTVFAKTPYNYYYPQFTGMVSKI